jgi:hypothetical protein
VAAPQPVERAIDAYRTALGLQPDALGVRAKLLRALFFRATFCGSALDERRVRFEEMRRVADEGLGYLDEATGTKKGDERLAAWRQVPFAAEALFWAAVAWGEWAMTHSRLAAVRAGAPGRIRDLAQSVIALDPDVQEGGGDLLLGRLHDKAPSIPFVSGFVSRDKALAHLRKAHAAYPDNTLNQVFLAEAILRHDPAHRDEALRLLARCAAAAPRPEYRVEDAHYSALARRALEAQR